VRCSHHFLLSFLTICPQPRPTLFPYTTLFRSPNISVRATRPRRPACCCDMRSTSSIESTSSAVFTRTTHRPGKWPRNLARRSRRSEEHTSELQSHLNLVCRLLLEKKKKKQKQR